MNHVGAVPVLAQRPVAAPAATAPVADLRQVVTWYAAFAAFAGVVFATSG
jgi:hypothetical protein